jgi:CRISPR-associated protein Csb2
MIARSQAERDGNALTTRPALSGVALILTFPARRYHATPWGHHVNEGLIEWPPSPWRLLRSLIATGYTKLRWPKEGPPSVAHSLLEKLASVLPSYRLPKVSGAHSRHYMPVGRLKGGREETTLVFDSWAQVDDESIGVHWVVELTQNEKQLFAELAAELGYLGRAESWVEAQLSDAIDDAGFDVRAGETRDRPGPEWEQVCLLAPLAFHEYPRWRERTLRTALEALPTVDGRGRPHSKKAQAKVRSETEATYPLDSLACLQVDTGWLQALGWNQPPGSRKVYYWRRSNSLEAAAPQNRARPHTSRAVNFVLLSIATETGNMHALPPIHRTLPQGELLHQALLSHTPTGCSPPIVLSGRGPEGQPLRRDEAHQHAHLIHLDLDGDGHLDHVMVWAPMGLDGEAQRMVRGVRRTFTKGSVAPLRLALSASGSRDDLISLPAPWGDRIRAVLGSASGARRWLSVTPFVPSRFLKPRGRNTLEGQVAAELVSRGFPAPLSVRSIDAEDLARTARHFVRRRSRGGSPPPVDCGYMLELEFKETVSGPMLLGYGSHFGLGLFAASL